MYIDSNDVASKRSALPQFADSRREGRTCRSGATRLTLAVCRIPIYLIRICFSPTRNKIIILIALYVVGVHLLFAIYVGGRLVWPSLHPNVTVRHVSTLLPSTILHINASTTDVDSPVAHDVIKIRSGKRQTPKHGNDESTHRTAGILNRKPFRNWMKKYSQIASNSTQKGNTSAPPPVDTDGLPTLVDASRHFIQSITDIFRPTDIDSKSGQAITLKNIGENARLYAHLFMIRQNMSRIAHEQNISLDQLEIATQNTSDTPVLLKGFSAAMNVLERSLFPWFDTYAEGSPRRPMFRSAWDAYTHAVTPNATDLRRGIVITTGSNHILVIQHSLTMLRRMGSKLPIEIAYCGDNDLLPEHRNLLSEINNITRPLNFSDPDSNDTNMTQFNNRTRGADVPSIKFIDMSDLLGEECKGGFALKPFAVLASSFRQVILMDNDALFFQPPETLFSTHNFTSTGSILFRDRSMPWLSWGRGPGTVRLLSEIAAPFYPSNLVFRTSRVTKKLTSEEIDSGVVVWDKLRVFPVILLTCLLNYASAKKYVYSNSFGDKESFWLAHEALHVPFTVGRGNGGAVGVYRRHPDRVCGPMFHPDESGRPLWCNGGMGRPKRRTTNIEYIVNATHWVFEEDANAQWYTNTDPYCLGIEDNVSSGALNGKDLAIATHAKNLWMDIFYRPK